MEDNLDRIAIANKATRLAALKRQIEDLTQEKDMLEGYFLRLSEQDLQNTKEKSVVYEGPGGRVTVTMAESVKVGYISYLKMIFGRAYPDAVKEDTKYKVSAPAARMLTGLYLKKYIKMTVAEAIRQIAPDSETKEALAKKVKGINPKTDKRSLMTIGGFDERSAEEYAYFVAEAAVWEEFCRLLRLRELDPTDPAVIEKHLDWINGAVTVEETPKITVEVR